MKAIHFSGTRLIKEFAQGYHFSDAATIFLSLRPCAKIQVSVLYLAHESGASVSTVEGGAIHVYQGRLAGDPQPGLAIGQAALASQWVDRVARHGRERVGKEGCDIRWSLVELFADDTEWKHLLEWAAVCSSSFTPHAQSLTAGLLLLSLGAAVARSQSNEEALWNAVYRRLSAPLAAELFATPVWPRSSVLESLEEVCEAFGLRHQLELSGKKRYWRTIFLQIGISPGTPPERLSTWLLGYGLPDTVVALLDADGPNGSTSFRHIWSQFSDLDRITDRTAIEVPEDLRQNPWFHATFKALFHLRPSGPARTVSGTFRPEGDIASNSLFGVPLLIGESFSLALSSFLPACLLERPLPASQLRLNGITYDLQTDAQGKVRLRQGSICVDANMRGLRASIYQRGEQVYSESVELWPEDTDLLVFNGRTGQRQPDLFTFRAITNTPYSLLTASDVSLQPPAAEIRAFSDRWCLHSFPDGLPAGLTASVESFPLWTLPEGSPENILTERGTLFITRLTLTELEMKAIGTRAFTIRSFRFAGKTIRGHYATFQVAPSFRSTARRVPALLESGQRIELDCVLQEKAFGAAWLDPQDTWNAMDPRRYLDGSSLEGQSLVVRSTYDEDDAECWLMLGAQPLCAEPSVLRLNRLRGMGEPLSLRQGLLNGSSRCLAPGVISSGQLAGVETPTSGYRLLLRRPSLRAADYRVHVWEAGHRSPRALNPASVVIDESGASLLVPEDAVREPLGWALSLHGGWRGARFMAEPQPGADDPAWNRVRQGWMEILDPAFSPRVPWAGLAFALRWWRFPVLLEPFRTAIAARTQAEPDTTCRIWMCRKEGRDMLCPAGERDGVVPFRELLWDFRPSDQESANVFAGIWRQPRGLFADEQGTLYPELEFLLESNPILLAHLVGGAIASLELDQTRKASVSARHSAYGREGAEERNAVAQAAKEANAARDILCNLLHARHGLPLGQAIVARQLLLRAEALRELASGAGHESLDEAYFQRGVVSAAEQARHQPNPRPEQLRIALARSPATRTYLACHLLQS